eukprot:CAMPEP_0179047858 /NCGR_PEP_ID=MMETSP0796-20121207/19413_1 /TAXON_ID=73915 /ORGANISM="Pyrodinium bahamense, Strain pbaha01" /LENGTH=442 /DNA_ID=CAMNT_0020744315 /DNA_START=152 /DNA_END=1480 /DNA_ORIENTATION=+
MGSLRAKGCSRVPSSPVALPAIAGHGPLEYVGNWWNETVEFWNALEIWEATPLREDAAAEAVALVEQLDRVKLTLLQVRAERANSDGASRTGGRKSEEVISALIEPLPGLLVAYYWMRITRTFSKRAVRKGLSSSVLYANIGITAVFFRVVVPRLLTAGSLDELFDAAGAVGIPDRSTLASMLEALQGYDTLAKVGLYTSAFVVEKLTMVSEVLPIQVGLKTLAPILFGGLLPGAIASAACETLGALCNFAIGRTFLTARLRDQSLFGGPPLGEARWFGALCRAAEEDGLRLVLLLRLAPVLPLPFDSYWYLLGALPVRPSDFAFAHFLGCLKTAFLDASFGMLLLTSVGMEGGAVQEQAQQIVLAETAAFAIVAVLIGTVASRLANDMLCLEEEDEVGNGKKPTVESGEVPLPGGLNSSISAVDTQGVLDSTFVKAARSVD